MQGMAKNYARTYTTKKLTRISTSSLATATPNVQNKIYLIPLQDECSVLFQNQTYGKDDYRERDQINMLQYGPKHSR